MLKVISIAILYISTANGGETVSISSSCNTKTKNGLYYIKPTVDGEIIPVICNNGYTMLDASLNFDQVSTYFTSMYQYGDDSKQIYGTDCSDSSGWRDWFIPANEDTSFRVAKACMECEAGGIHGDNTGYYMTNGYFCPTWYDTDGCTDANVDATLTENVMCNICDDTDGLCGADTGREGFTISDPQSYTTWCDCYSLQLTADHKTESSHAEYCQEDLDWRPSVVIDRSQCTCYKPDESENVEYEVDYDDLPLVSTEYQGHLGTDLYIDGLIQWDDEDSETNTKKWCNHQMTHLTQEDFLRGTYRITECGRYVLDEDIIINFNAPSDKFSYENGDSPNGYAMDDLPWFPTTEQQDSGDYFGFNAFWGPFTLGFFAGISIESDHVYINLNGHTIEMAPDYYLQQRFFALIELGNKQFEARQGPVDFSRVDIHLKDIEIQNGVLGLSSHHGIHGAFAQQIHISGLEIQHFDVGGIQCNGCFHMLIEDCDIGPQNTNIPVLGRYVHGRSVLGRLRYMVDEYGDEELQYANRDESTTVKAVADKLVEQMDMVFYHITQGIEFSDDNEQWIAAKQTFLNPTGWLDGGSAYGILLNGEGTAVVNIGRRVTNTYDITVKDVKIHDLAAMPRENFWAATNDGDENSAIVHGFFFETIDWNHGHVYDEDTGYYTGDAYTDVLFAANTYLTEDFCPLGSLFYLDGIADWVFEDGVNIFDRPGKYLEFLCGSDIQSHSAKGPIGIRIDGTKEFTLENIHIFNLQNWGEIGSDACGEYEEITFAEGFDVDKDIQYGYSGDNTHGILTDYAEGTMKDITIENLESWHGQSMGIFVGKGSTVAFDGYVNVDHLIAGQKLTQEESDALILPNAQPFVCSIFIGPNSDADTNPEFTPVVTTTDDFVVKGTTAMYGYDYCTDDVRVGDMSTPMSPELLHTDDDEPLPGPDFKMFRDGNRYDNIVDINGVPVSYSAIAIAVTFIIVALFILGKMVCNKQSKSIDNDRTRISLSSTSYGSM